MADVTNEEKLTPAQLKKINRNKIYQLIYAKKMVNRQEIANDLFFSLPTVNQNLKELKEWGLIEFCGEFSSTGGRKAQVIVPCKEAKLSIALNIRKSYVRIAVVDMLGEILTSKKENIEFESTVQYAKQIGKCVEKYVCSFCAEKKIERERILGIGITVPGIFDVKSQKIIKAPTLNIVDYDIGILVENMPYNAIVINDAKASAYNYMRKCNNFDYGIYLLVDGGVGGCIIDNGKIIKGVNNRAGEIGHMTLIPKGKKCACGKFGCVEAYLSIKNIEDTGVLDDEYLEMLAMTINNIQTVFDAPVVIGGNLSLYLESYMDKLLSIINQNNFLVGNENILIDSYSKKEALTGAALMLVDEYVDSI